MLHDRSFISFPGEVTRRGLPRDGDKQGFHLHAALAVAEGPARVVPGLVGVDVYTVWSTNASQVSVIVHEKPAVDGVTVFAVVQLRPRGGYKRYAPGVVAEGALVLDADKARGTALKAAGLGRDGAPWFSGGGRGADGAKRA